jgi:hypothetical protein
MGKIQAIPKQLTDKEELEKLTKETLAITKVNAKELSEEEKHSIREAEKLNVRDYPIIFPIRATIGFMTRNMDGKNHQAIEFVRSTFPAQVPSKSYLMMLVDEFDSLDEHSQNRVDCLDILTRKHRITPMRFLDALTEGITVFHNYQTKAIIASKKPDLAEKILKSAENESLKSAEHKKLAAKIAGLIDEKPLVQVDTGSKTTVNSTTNNNLVLSFTEFVKSNDKLIRGQVEEKKDYIEGESVE